MTKYLPWLCAALVALTLSVLYPASALAQAGPSAAPTSTVDVHALPPAAITNFDPEKATNAYLAKVSGEARAKVTEYVTTLFEAGEKDMHRLTVCGLTYLRERDGSSDPVKAGYTGL